MQDQPTHGPDLTRDDILERTKCDVLMRLLDLYPAQLTLAEVIADYCGEHPAFDEREAVEITVRDLGCAGLLHRRDDLVWPSRAAVAAEVLRLV